MGKKMPIFLMAIMLMAVVCTACGHEHAYGEWTVEKAASCTAEGQKARFCECEEKQTEVIPTKGHTEGDWIVDAEASCTKDGSKHLECAECKAIMKSETIPATGAHSYREEITVAASCANDGVKTFTCSSCGDSYTESYGYKSYSPTEIYDLYLSSVGEVVTYDKSGNEYAFGSCFVCSADGKIITNYHVIEKAYSAQVLLGGATYQVQQVLAYDKNIDVAVLKISASGLKPAQLC